MSKSRRPGWKRYTPATNNAVQVGVWARVKATSKYHRVWIDGMTTFTGRITDQVNPVGGCPTARKVDWSGMGIHTSDPEWSDRCAHCSSLPKAAL